MDRLVNVVVIRSCDGVLWQLLLPTRKQTAFGRLSQEDCEELNFWPCIKSRQIALVLFFSNLAQGSSNFCDKGTI